MISFIKAENRSTLGSMPASEMEWPRQYSSRRAEASLRERGIEGVFAQMFGAGSYRLDVGRRIRVEQYHIIEVGRHLCQTFNAFVNHFREPAERRTAALGYDEPLVEARGGANRRERDSVLVLGSLVERGDQLNRKNTSPFTKGSRTWSTREIGNWLRRLIWLSFL